MPSINPPTMIPTYESQLIGTVEKYIIGGLMLGIGTMIIRFIKKLKLDLK
jgi:hypothetical protein